MLQRSTISESWTPERVSRETIATGTWSYQSVREYAVELVRERWNFTAFDIPRMLELLSHEAMDSVDYAVSDEGVLYLWRFANGPDVTWSKGLSTYFQAREHIESYGYPFDVRWPEDPRG